MRVYELAKKLDIPNKALIAKLQEAGFKITSHMNVVPEAAVERMRAPVAPESKSDTPKQTGPRQKKSVSPARERHDIKAPPKKSAIRPEQPAASKVLKFRGAIVVKDLAEQMGMKPNQLITELMMMNVLASINERVDVKAAQQIAEKHGFSLELEKRAPDQRPAIKKAEDKEEEEEDRPEDLRPRNPIVTFLGHIDHGKTSLLDYIRQSSVAKREAGGITQHIGAYTITRNGQKITFLDTPGHAAFTAMRARGANLTDIAIVVIAADDGIMPQTREAIKHAQAANTAIIVAINKIDLPGARPEHVMTQLQSMNLTPEEWGGEIICCQVSAITGAGMDNLLDMILLQAEMMELKANPKARAQGYIIEAQMEQGVGPTAHMLVTRGTLQVGDIAVCGPFWGRIKSLMDDHGRRMRTAGPATPVKSMGLSGIPQAGDKFKVYLNDKIARAAAEKSRLEMRDVKTAVPKKASLEELFANINENKPLELRLVLKCDTQGSLEAIQHALSELHGKKVTISIILGGIGNITANDVLLAGASNAIVMGFNVGKEPGIPAIEKREGVEVRLYGIIYDILDEIRQAMTGMLAPELKEKPVGKAEVRQVFDISKKGRVAGCMVVSGKAMMRCKTRVRRKGDIMYEGAIVTLKHFQDDVGEVREGMECGIRLDNFASFEPGDEIEFFEIEEIPQEL